MVTQELINYIKEALSKGQSMDMIKSSLAQGGWSGADIDEAARAINPVTPPPSQFSPSLSAQTPKSSIWKIVVVILVLVALGFGGWYYSSLMKATTPVVPVEQNPITQNQAVDNQLSPSNNQTQVNEIIGDSEVKIISPKMGDEFQAGDVITVNFIVGKKVTSVAALYGPVSSSIAPEQKTIDTAVGGNYNFTYSVPNIFTGSVEFNIFSSDPVVIAHDTIAVKVTSSLAPVEFIFDEGENSNPYNSSSQIGLWYMPEPQARSSVGIKLKYSDGRIKDVAPKDIQYKIQDNTIIEIYPGNFSNLLFYGKNIGSTNVTFTYKNVTKTMKVVVNSIY